MKNSVTIKMKALTVAIAAACVCVFGFVSCEDGQSGAGAAHDPSKPVVITSFMPDTGRIAEMMILDGSNFGTDVSKIKVFFNEKEAKVIGSTNETVLALVPRLPGDTCVIAVEIGGQKVSAPKFFYYMVEANASTFAGNGDETLSAGTLDQCQLKPVMVYADNGQNIFVSTADDYLVRLNEEENSITVLASSAHGMAANLQIDVDPNTGMFMMGSALTGNRDRFVFIDPELGWTPKSYYIKKWKDDDAVPEDRNEHFHCLYCKANGYYYTYYNTGYLVRINPETWEASIISKDVSTKTVYGMAFHPKNPAELWIGDDGGDIYTVDVTFSTGTFKRVTSGAGAGFRDGRLDQAQFSGIRQMVFDEDGILYVADNNNHCIRKINTETKKVETIIGIPQAAGFVDGKKDDALFRNPHGIAIDADDVIFVADYGNARVRRVAVE
jgi:sugar lactone lactonase YvrE